MKPRSELLVGESTRSLYEMAHGGRPQGCSVYARLHDPTVDRFEQALALLEEGAESVAFEVAGGHEAEA